LPCQIEGSPAFYPIVAKPISQVPLTTIDLASSNWNGQAKSSTNAKDPSTKPAFRCVLSDNGCETASPEVSDMRLYATRKGAVLLLSAANLRDSQAAGGGKWI
jgi:hypothetical protein